MNIITEYFDAGDAGFSLWRLTSVNQRHFKTNQPASPASLWQKIGDAGDAGKKICPGEVGRSSPLKKFFLRTPFYFLFELPEQGRSKVNWKQMAP